MSYPSPYLLPLAAALIVLAGCATVPMGDARLDASAKTFAAPADGKAGLYVYRNESMGAAIRMDVLIDGQPMGQTAAKTYLYTELAPGRHVLVSKAENTETLDLDLRAGSQTFVWQEVKMGLLMARSKLSVVSAQEGRAGVMESQRIAGPSSVAAPAAGLAAAPPVAPRAAPVTLAQAPEGLPAGWTKPPGTQPLKAESLVGHTWRYPHPRDPQRWGDVELVFRADSLTASNKVSQAAGTWEVGDDVLCFSADHGWGRVCMTRTLVDGVPHVRLATGRTVPLQER